MTPFEYAAPSTLKEAGALLSDKWGETEILAGGTDLLTSLKQGLIAMCSKALSLLMRLPPVTITYSSAPSHSKRSEKEGRSSASACASIESLMLRLSEGC